MTDGTAVNALDCIVGDELSSDITNLIYLSYTLRKWKRNPMLHHSNSNKTIYRLGKRRRDREKTRR